MSVSPEAVWSVLEDAATYPRWLLGMTEVRRSDANWPAPGTSFDYRFRWGPVKLTGRATVVEAHPPGHLRVRWKRRLLGTSTADITLERTADHTDARMTESSDGLFVALSANPFADGLATANNTTSLDRLERLARAASRQVT